MFGNVDIMKNVLTNFTHALLRRIFGPKRDELRGTEKTTK
jgi:hypothetical protein